jgi:hypothetical protein
MVGLGKKYFDNPCRTASMRFAMKTKPEIMSPWYDGNPMTEHQNSVNDGSMSMQDVQQPGVDRQVQISQTFINKP